MSRKATGGGLEVKDHTIHRRPQLLVSKGDPALHQAPIEIGKIRLQLGRLLIEQSNLTQPFRLALHQFAAGFSNDILLIEVLDFRESTSGLQLLITLQNFCLKGEIVLQHQHLFLVHLHGVAFFLLLERQLLLFELDRLLQAVAEFLAGFCVQLHQHLASLHPITLLHKDLIGHTSHRHLDVLNGTNRLELAGCHDNFFGTSEGQPSHPEQSAADQGPSDGAHPEATLLEDRFVVGGEIGGILRGSGVDTAQNVA